jgi:hypothetical protein
MSGHLRNVRKFWTANGKKQEFFTSITHLKFDPRLPLAREITAYQKHRVKKLRRQAG